MIHALALQLVIGLVGITLSSTLVPAANPPRRVEVRVSVTTDGPPFPAGTYVAMSAPSEAHQAIIDAPTDANGHVVLIGEYPAELTQVVVSVPTIVFWGPEQQMVAKDEAAKLADRAFSLPPAKFITLQPGQEVYTVVFFAPEAITVRGRALDDQGQPLSVSADRAGMINIRFDSDDDAGLFEVFGVPKGQDSFIFLMTDRPEKVIVWLTAAQTGGELDLGDITLPAVTNDATIEIGVTGRETVRHDDGMQRNTVTLIREDGRAAYTFEVTEQGGIAHAPPGLYPGPPKVQAGRYYMVPGMANTSDSSLKALRLIRAGQGALLDAASVPVIEPVSNQTTAGTIDLSAVQQIIDGLPG